MIKKLGSLLLLLLIAGSGTAAQNRLTAVKAGRILTGTGEEIINGIIIIENGRISAVGQNILIPEDSEIIDATGLTVIPGLIDAFSHLGTEDSAVNENDTVESSPVMPHLRIIDAINPQNRIIPLERSTGVTMALSAPGDSGLLPGQSALIRLSGRKIDDMIIRFPAAVHCNLGETVKNAQRYPSTRMGAAALLRQTLIDAKQYAQTLREKEDSPVDLKKEALIPILEGRLPIIIKANRMDDILTALRIAEEFSLKIIIAGGADAFKVSGRLAARKTPVILTPESIIPHRQETRKARPDCAGLLQKEGVLYTFGTGSDIYQGLLNQVYIAIRHGLSEKAALKALTVQAAEIFGISDAAGSIAPGKEAHLVFITGNPFSPKSQIIKILINKEWYYLNQE